MTPLVSVLLQAPSELQEQALGRVQRRLRPAPKFPSPAQAPVPIRRCLPSRCPAALCTNCSNVGMVQEQPYTWPSVPALEGRLGTH